MKEILVSFYVHQHQFLNFLPFSQEERTRIVFCVHQHHCIIFELCSPVTETIIVFDVQQNHWPKSVLSYLERGTLDIVLLLQNLFSNFFWRNIQHAFNLSWCSSAENSCNLRAIIAIILIFFHKYLVFLLHPSSFIYIIVWKTNWYIFSDPKEAGIENKLQWQAIAMLSSQLNV